MIALGSRPYSVFRKVGNGRRTSDAAGCQAVMHALRDCRCALDPAIATTSVRRYGLDRLKRLHNAETADVVVPSRFDIDGGGREDGSDWSGSERGIGRFE